MSIAILSTTIARIKEFLLGDRVKSASDIITNQGNDKLEGDLYTRFIRSIYFPFILRFHNVIILTWFIVFIICIVYGPQFLSLTKNSLDLPSTVPSAEAISAYQSYYPSSSGSPPVLIYQHNSIPGGSIINQYTHDFSNDLKTYANSHSAIQVLKRS